LIFNATEIYCQGAPETVGRTALGSVTSMPGEWFEWEWDDTLFTGSAAYYEQGRLPYAEGLAAALTATLDLDGHGRLLDVGCGPGTVARQLAAGFDEVVGLDADRDMIAEAERLAAAQGVANAQWICRRAEELPADLGTFRVATFAQSLHWMDRPRVFAAVHGMVVPGGGVVHVGSQPARDAVSAEWPVVPDEVIEDLRRRYLGADRRAGQSIRNSSPDDEDDVFRSVGFDGPEIVVVPEHRLFVRTIDDVVAHTFSSSGTAPHLFGSHVDDFEADLRAALTVASTGGRFSVPTRDTLLKIWRPG
jgi:SAM-dependent methyltransferase